MRRTRATHLLNSYSFNEDSTDDYGSPIKSRTQDLSAEQVRLIPSKTFIRNESGERVTEDPKIVGPLTLRSIEEGDEIELIPINELDSNSLADKFEVIEVKINKGRASKSSSVTLILEEI